MKVFLVQPPLWGISPPIGLAQLGAFLARAGHEVRAFDANLDLYLRRGEARRFAWEGGFSVNWCRPEWVGPLLDEHRAFIDGEYLRPIAEAGPCAVGFSISSCSYVPALLLAERVKRANPDAKVLFGGQHFAVNRDAAVSAVATGWVDAAVLGDGEATAAEALARWGEGRELDGCAGLWHRAGGRAVFGGARRPVDLDAMPFADFRLFPVELYENYDAGAILFMASRGCVRSCMFCGYRTPWPGFRAMSGRRIHAEILHQRRELPRARALYFYDLLVNGDMRALEELCDLLVAGPQAPLPWQYCNAVIRPEMTAAVCRELASAGCQNMQIGLESGSQHVLDLMRKEQETAVMERVLQNLSEAGITVKGNFMFGFPGETEADFEETLAFLRRVGRWLPEIYPSYTFTLMEPASPLGLHRDRYGVVSDGRDSDVFWVSADGTNDYPTRFARYRRFCELAESLGAKVEYGYKVPIEAFQSFWLGRYHEHRRDDAKALGEYETYLSHDPHNREIQEARDGCRRRLELAVR